MARDQGASVIVVEENHDIGGHGMLSGARIPLGGGTSLQKKYGIQDSADQVYFDHTNHQQSEFKFADRDLVRTWADENVATFEFLIEQRSVAGHERPLLGGGRTLRITARRAANAAGPLQRESPRGFSDLQLYHWRPTGA
jgi:hypothetical protein